MPKETPDVQWESEVLFCGVSLKFGIAPALAFGQREVTPIPVLVPRLCHPPIHWSMIHSSCSMCSTYSLSGPSHAGFGNVLSVRVWVDRRLDWCKVREGWDAIVEE